MSDVCQHCGGKLSVRNASPSGFFDAALGFANHMLTTPTPKSRVGSMMLFHQATTEGQRAITRACESCGRFEGPLLPLPLALG